MRIVTVVRFERGKNVLEDVRQTVKVYYSFIHILIQHKPGVLWLITYGRVVCSLLCVESGQLQCYGKYSDALGLLASQSTVRDSSKVIYIPCAVAAPFWCYCYCCLFSAIFPPFFVSLVFYFGVFCFVFPVMTTACSNVCMYGFRQASARLQYLLKQSDIFKHFG